MGWRRVWWVLLGCVAPGLYVVCWLIPSLGMDPGLRTLVADLLIALVALIWLDRLGVTVRSRDPGVRRMTIWLVLAILVWLVSQLATTGLLDYDPDGLQAMRSRRSSDWGIVASLVGAPVAEELAIRGVMASYWTRVDPWLGWIGSSVVFAALHGTLAQFPGMLLLGLFLMLVRVQAGLTWAIGMHMAYNLACLYANGMALPSWMFHPLATIPACMLLAVPILVGLHGERARMRMDGMPAEAMRVEPAQ